jgi:hypothetical protein
LYRGKTIFGNNREPGAWLDRMNFLSRRICFTMRIGKFIMPLQLFRFVIKVQLCGFPVNRQGGR